MTLLFPHPVLLPNGNDYRDGCSFGMEIDNPQRTLDERIRVPIRLALESGFLRRLLAKKQAEFFVVIRCVRTYMREIHRTTDTKMLLDLQLADYADKITLTPFMASTVAIKSFSSREHDEEFCGIPISLPVGAILAMGTGRELTVDSLQTLSAAICLSTCNELDKGSYAIDVDDDRINILMHNETRHKVENLRKTDRQTLFPALYMSVLTHAIQNMDEVPTRKWAEALAKTLEKTTYTEEEKKEKPYKIAQRLLNNPLRYVLERENGNG